VITGVLRKDVRHKSDFDAVNSRKLYKCLPNSGVLKNAHQRSGGGIINSRKDT
jgi:hypothetical protein